MTRQGARTRYISPTAPAAPGGYPNLRAALWLLLAASLATGLAVIGLRGVVEDAFVRLVAALFFAAGFTGIAIQFNKLQFPRLMGRLPAISTLIAALAAGGLLWLPAAWLILALEGLLVVAFGSLPAPQALASGAALPTLVVTYGLIIPLCQGVLFWGFVQRGAEGMGLAPGAVLTAVLFGLFSLVSVEFGFAAVLPYTLIGLTAALAGHYTESGWIGIAVMSGHGLTRALFENTPAQSDLFVTLGAEQYGQLFEGRWLLAVLVTAFGVFVLLQMLRISVLRGASPHRARLGKLWYVPLIALLALTLLLANGERSLRMANRLAEPPAPGATSPPR